MSYNLKSIKEEFKSKGIYYTQTELALYIKSLIDININDVYDPTCGDGGLLSVFDDNLPKYGQEINDHQLEIANERLNNFTGICADTLKDPAFMGKQFSCIVANPPFSIQWQPPTGLFKDDRFIDCPALPPKGKADYAFILHIIHLLAYDGIAIVLNFPGVLYRGNSEGIIRRWLVQRNLIEKVIRIEGKKFVDTSIETCIIIFKKNKKTTDIEFIDTEKNISKIVTLEDVAKNDYILSVNTYAFIEEKKEILNPIHLQKISRKQMIERIRKDIEIDKMVCELEGWDFYNYINDLDKLINDFKVKI
jgi:type I restriction system adenine methylase HsdM